MPPYNFERYLERAEESLCKRLDTGEISHAEFELEMKALRDEERDAYMQDREDAMARVDDEWGYR